jgi:TonB family protein
MSRPCYSLVYRKGVELRYESNWSSRSTPRNRLQQRFGALVLILAWVQVGVFVQPSLAHSPQNRRPQNRAKTERAKAYCGGGSQWVNADSLFHPDPSATDLVLGQAVRKVYPAYPQSAVASRVQGDVIVQVVVSRAGEVASIKFASGPTDLIDASTRAARGWKFTPTTSGTDAVEVMARLTFHYDLGLQR